MSSIANLAIHTLPKLAGYREHYRDHLLPLDGKRTSRGTVVRVPSFDALQYFHRQAKIANASAEEIAARVKIFRELCRIGGAAVAEMWELIRKFWPRFKTLGMDDREAASFIEDVCGRGYGNMVLASIKQSEKWDHVRQLQANDETNDEIVESVRKNFDDKTADGLKSQSQLDAFYSVLG